MSSPSFDHWTILFLFAAAQGLFLSILLFISKKGNVKANKILATILVLFSISIIYYVLYWTKYAEVLVWTNGWVASIPFLYGPLLFLYFINLEQRQKPKNFYLHFIPFFLHTLFMIPIILRNVFGVIPFLRDYYFKPWYHVIPTIDQTFYVLQCASLCVYSIVFFFYVYQDQLKLNEFSLNEEKAKHHWIKMICIFFFIFSLANLSYYILVWKNLLQVEYDYAISAVMSIFIYTVGYMGFHQPVLFQSKDDSIQNLNSEHLNTDENRKPVLQIHVSPKKVKYQNSSLSKNEIETIQLLLLHHMENEKPYLSNTLTMANLAAQIKISSHHLSQVLNMAFQRNYNEFINGYRIAEAQKILSDPKNEDKILSIAFDVGYNNKATFNAAFKKIVGSSPSVFRKEVLQKAIA